MRRRCRQVTWWAWPESVATTLPASLQMLNTSSKFHSRQAPGPAQNIPPLSLLSIIYAAAEDVKRCSGKAMPQCRGDCSPLCIKSN